MSPSIILDKENDDIQAAMAITLSQHKHALGLTYEKIGKVIERERQSVAQYMSGNTEMPAACWIKLIAKWPELAERLEYNLDEAERTFRSRQRELRLYAPEAEGIAA